MDTDFLIFTKLSNLEKCRYMLALVESAQQNSLTDIERVQLEVQWWYWVKKLSVELARLQIQQETLNLEKVGI